MFYSQFILAKKGPLGTIWIAAHLERKLRKNQIADTDIALSVDSILFPEMPIALRLSSHLLLGVVRIYSKKVNYLFDDCSEALLKVKQAFRSTAVDLPPEKSTAPYHSITMPETFDLDDFELPDSYLQGNYVDQHISSKEQITLQDTMQGVVYSTSKFGLDERFDDADAYDLDLDEELFVEKAAANPDLATGTSNSDHNPQASIHASASGILSQELDEYDGNNEPVDYAQAPCTPGLWEEPNLSNVQETSACDDHQEPENHTVTEFAVKENLESASHHNQFEPHEKSLPHVAETEHMLINDLGATPFTEAETVIPVSKGPSQEENILNKIVSDVPPGFQIANHNQENFVQYQGNQENAFHLSTELESNIENDNCVSTPQHYASLEPKDSTLPVSFPHAASMPNSDFPVLRPCVTFPNQETNDYPTPAIQREVQIENIDIYPNDHPAPVIQNQVQVENINSYTDDLSAPEKRLSLPHWLSDVPKSFVPESTPIENDITSGKKRTFTESSMTPDTLNLNESSSLHTTNTTSQSFNLNQSSGLFTTNTTAQIQSLNLNESSDFYTTNTTAQSLNLNQSSGPFTINMTEQFVMNDDDLLSSILVGRKSSLLKPKPTPPVVTLSTKRRRSAPTPKTSAIKRKVLMDDPMVLHGDTIRAQLTNTEDVRRLRKKAPCTRSEISMLQKQFWEDDLFSEPIFTGVSVKLASLHSQLYDLSKIVVSHDDAPFEGEKDPESISQNVTQMIGGTDVPKENTHVAQPIEYPMVRDNHTHDNTAVNLDYYGNQPPQTVATEPEPFNSEHDLFGERDAMEIDPKSFPDVSIMPTEVEPEPATHAVVVPSDTFGMSTTTGEVQIDASLQIDAPGVSSSEKIDLQSFDLDIHGNKSIESDLASEIKIDVRVMLEEKQDQDTEFRINEAVVNEDVEYNVQHSVYNGIFGEEFGTVGAYDTEVNPDHQVTFEMTEMNVEDIPASNRVGDDESTRPAVENNTDFLNFDDDDDEADAGGDYGTDVEATRVIDNSGWSTRTKAVAKYLHVMFDKEGERGRNMIAVNNLLVGKTRKEASRMFFETLVLKTKDYIHVEQGDPFGNINVFPRANLLKSDF